MTNPHGRRIQARRATAILAWGTMVLLAILLRYARVEGLIRSQVWEPAAMILSAFVAFLSLFCWLLFSPQRGTSTDESPALFFAGMLTLIPPSFIAWYLMPPSSPLRAWVALGVLIFGVLAILSPVPEELFRIPRDRRSYLRPVTDATLSMLDVDAPVARFDDIVPRTVFRLTGQEPVAPERKAPAEARDPWLDPFRGTGRRMSRVVPGGRAANTSDLPDAGSGKAPVPVPRALAEQYPIEESVPLSESQRGVASSPDIGGVQSALRVSATPNPTSIPALPLNAMQATASAVAEPREGARHGASVETGWEERVGGAGEHAGSRPDVSVRRPLRDPEVANRAKSDLQRTESLNPGSLNPGKDSVSESVSRGKAAGASNAGHSTPASAPMGPVGAPLTTATAAKAATGAIATAAGIGFGMASAGAARAASLMKSVVRRPEESRQAERPSSGPAVPAYHSKQEIVEAEKVAESPANLVAGAEVSTKLRELDRMLRDEFKELDEDIEGDRVEHLAGAGVTSAENGLAVGEQSDSIRLERTTDEFGGEMIEGTGTAIFAVGQKRVHLHVALSPPMAGVPLVECEPVGEESLRVRVALRQPYGIRIEVRRTEASNALNAEIAFSAVYTPTRRA